MLNSSASRRNPKALAMAGIWRKVLVDPPMAALTRIMLRKLCSVM